ncbi:MAG: hypothetical protein ACXVB9_05375 [Bdellovibrionota bacterium]
MNKFSLALLLAALAIAPQAAKAGFQGSISFTDDERAAHEQAVDQIESTAAACLARDLNHHKTFFQRYGFSPYYGDRGSFGKLSYEGKREYLRQNGFNPALLEQMQPISCVELMLNCLGEGFKSAGEGEFWSRIRAFTILNGVDGMATQYGLQQLGWKVLYWNPDVRYNRQWDQQERQHNPTNSDRFWGDHEEYWQSVQHQGRYLYNHVDDIRLLVNFGTTSPSFLRSVPFWVAIAHGGYHVFPGTFGQVVEAHSTRQITDPKSLQSAPFNPLAGLAPTDGMYHSGIIAVPGKYLK